MKPIPKVGQTLYSLNINNAARNTEQKLTPVKVTKIGRKYFECVQDGWSLGITYHIDNWCEKTKYTSNSKLYEKPKDWENEKLEKYICELINRSFPYGYNRKGISLENLKKIQSIITLGFVAE